MALNIGKEMTALKRMTVPELRRKHAQVFGEDTVSRDKEFLIRLTAARPRPMAPGGETGTAPIEFPKDDRLPMPGAIITRRYKNQTIEVRVLPKGFEHEGDIYRTLSAVAMQVTGTHRKGFHFFKLGEAGCADGR